MKKHLIYIVLFIIGFQSMSQPFGKAINLDGADDYLVVPHHESLNPGNGSWSVAFWIKAANKNQVAPLVNKRLAAVPYTQYSYGFGKDDPHDPQPGKSFRINHIQEAGVHERSGHITENVIDGKWHHIAVVADKIQDKIIVYVDGLPKSVYPLYYYGSWPNVATTTELFIGRGSSGTSKVEGILDELSIWKKAISPELIQLMLTDTLAMPYYNSVDSGLVAYYRFDVMENLNVSAGTNDDFRDYSVYGNHADAEGSPALMPSLFLAAGIYVDQSNNTGVEYGTEIHPFNTIDEGMAAADSGKTIIIKPGAYNPSGGILYLKPGVKLEGETAANTIINGDLKDTCNSGLAVKLEKLAFNDFIFWRPASINVNITEPSYIKDCRCKNIRITHVGGFTDQSGTELGPIPYFQISDNVMEQSIVYAHGPGIIVGENIISGNETKNIVLSHGLTALAQNQPVPDFGYLIEKNTVEDELAFNQGGSENVAIRVKENKARAISVASGGGFYYEMTDNMLQDGYFDSGGNNKILFSGNTILNGTISDRSGGLRDGTEDAIIENNTIHYKNPSSEVRLIIDVRSSSISLKNNKITGEGRLSGIQLSSGPPTNVINNEIILEPDSHPLGDIESTTFAIRTIAGEGIVTGNKIQGAYLGYYSSSGASEFSNNEITNAHHGFFSSGLEEVKNNTIKNCSGHGMILSGLKGPVHDNIITDNDSAGIYVIRNMSFGGGGSGSIKRNIIRNNGWYDLVNAYNPEQEDTLFAEKNVWDHETLNDILQLDILNLYPKKVTLNIDSFIALPGAPVLSSPENALQELGNAINLIWQPSANAEYYQLQLAIDTNFENLVYTKDSINNLNFEMDSLTYNTTYYWRCRASNLAGESSWSETWWFYTGIKTGVSEYEEQMSVFIFYPNPAKNKVIIHFNDHSREFNVEDVEFEIYDLNGRKLLEKQISAETNDIEVDVCHLINGVYFCRLIFNKYSATKKLIIQK